MVDTNVKTPRVSIIMPFYNRAEVINATIESVLHQSYHDFELICVDDGSTDSVPSILMDYAAKDRRIKIITKSHTNPGDARNLGYNHSVGEYIFFLDSDDLYHRRFVEKMLSTMQQTKTDLVICDCQYFDHLTGLPLSVLQTESNNKLKFENLNRTELTERVFDDGCAVMRRLFRRQVIEQYQIQFQSLNCAEDHLFVFNYTLHCHDAVILEEVLVWHRTNDPESISNLRNRNLNLFCYCEAMDAVRACISPENWQHLQSSFQRYYLSETCYAIVRSNYRQGKRIFQHTRKSLRPIKSIKIDSFGNYYRVRAQKLYKLCLILNQFWFFALAKNLMLKLKGMGGRKVK